MNVDMDAEGREGKGGERQGREGKGREEKGRGGKGREGKGRRCMRTREIRDGREVKIGRKNAGRDIGRKRRKKIK